MEFMSHIVPSRLSCRDLRSVKSFDGAFNKETLGRSCSRDFTCTFLQRCEKVRCTTEWGMCLRNISVCPVSHSPCKAAERQHRTWLVKHRETLRLLGDVKHWNKGAFCGCINVHRTWKYMESRSEAAQARHLNRERIMFCPVQTSVGEVIIDGY